ncbi:hypothetical protein [Halomonas sp. E19]|uniref:hypothetical protein n=1 Tax=Halomonas sp. E19 TaxID=3397247 RepID=UPI0040340E2C
MQVIARWGGFGGSDVVIADDDGIGFDLNPLPEAADRRARFAWQALASLRGELNPEYPADATLWERCWAPIGKRALRTPGTMRYCFVSSVWCG